MPEPSFCSQSMPCCPLLMLLRAVHCLIRDMRQEGREAEMETSSPQPKQCSVSKESSNLDLNGQMHEVGKEKN